MGDVGCFSFFADKTITTGEGGYVVCKSAETYEKLLLLRNQGRINRGTFIHPAIGYNFRITDLQAAVGLAQLQKLPEIAKRKLAILSSYRERLQSFDKVKFLDVQEGSTYVPFRVVLICERAHDLMTFLDMAGIQTRSFFYPMHRQPCFINTLSGGLSDELFPNAIHGYDHGLCLPVYPTLKEKQIEYICHKIREFYSHV
jgi:perosamine synthetase